MYTLLQRQAKAPRQPIANLVNPTLEQVAALLPIGSGQWALDLETCGLDPSDPTCYTFGIGLANAQYCLYLDLRGASEAVVEYTKRFLDSVSLTSFNVKFDGGFLQQFTGKWLNWVGCSYGMFRYLATEGFPGQEWGLEVAQRCILGWQESNKTVLADTLTARQLTKADLWQVEAEIVGPYCAGDADAAWQLWEYFTQVCKRPGFDYLMKFHQREFLTLVQLLVEQQFRGMAVDKEQLTTYQAGLHQRIQLTMNSFLTHPQVAPHIEAYNQAVMDKWKLSEPSRTVKSGAVAKNWEKWLERGKTVVADMGFNPNSKQQLAELFYKKIFSIARETPEMVVVTVEGKQIEVEKTEGGALSVKKQILPVFGSPGAVLMQYNKLVKESGYVRAANGLLELRPTIHPEMNSAGTVTGRPAGGEADVD